MPKKHTNNEEICDLFLIDPLYKRALAYHEGYDLFYLLQNGWWKKLSPSQLEKAVIKFLRDNKLSENINENSISTIIYLLKRAIDIRFTEEETDYIAFSDCLLDLTSFSTLSLDFASDHLITFQIPIKYSDCLESPVRFMEFLKTSLCLKTDDYSPTASAVLTQPDNQLIALVQEMMGYFMLGKTPDQAAFFLVGDGANGKSVLANIIRDIIGHEFVSAMTVQSLTMDKFKASHLIGKKVNISNEEESKFIKSDKFKAIITHEMIDAEWKFGKSFEFIPTTKFLYCSNLMPTFENLNVGLRRRMQIIPFYRVFESHEQDRSLPAKLRQELPQIVGFALEGACRLISNGFRFTKSQASEEAKREFEDEISASVRFIRENYDIGDNNFTSNKDLYEHFKAWCLENGKKPCNSYSFLKDILHNIRGMKSIHKRQGLEVPAGKNVYPKNTNNNIEINDEQPFNN